MGKQECDLCASGREKEHGINSMEWVENQVMDLEHLWGMWNVFWLIVREEESAGVLQILLERDIDEELLCAGVLRVAVWGLRAWGFRCSPQLWPAL